MQETNREKTGMTVGILGNIVPVMAAGGFWPALDVLPLAAWIGIAALSGALGGAIATPRLFRGLVSGSLAGTGALLVTIVYILLRSAISETFWNIELVLVGLLGAAPGLLLYRAWARDNPDYIPDGPA